MMLGLLGALGAHGPQMGAQRHHPLVEELPRLTGQQRALPPPASTSHVTADFLLSLLHEQHSHLLNPLLFPHALSRTHPTLGSS